MGSSVIERYIYMEDQMPIKDQGFHMVSSQESPTHLAQSSKEGLAVLITVCCVRKTRKILTTYFIVLVRL